MKSISERIGFMFLFDTHVHTKEVSPCGNVSAAKTVRLYHEAGYSGLCITDHLKREYIRDHCFENWKEYISCFLRGWHAAKAEGEQLGMNVLLGAELCLDESVNEYLLFGINEKFLYDHPDLYAKSLPELRKIADQNDILIFQAHPFRPEMERADTRLLDGVEAVNGNPRHNSHNELAAQFAEKNKLLVCAGSDCHEIEDVGRSGIRTQNRICNLFDLKNILKNGAFECISIR